jgi:iron-sulfur cluster assembly protein
MGQKGMADTHALRVFVKGGGCGGMQYGMTFDQAREGDEVYEQHGLRVLVDATSLFYIDGANIDYIDNLMGGGFHIDNPQATSSCGCGSSFRTAKTHDGQEVAEKSCGH